MKWIIAHKYEFENHFTDLDWLKIYSEAIQDQKINMNRVLLTVGQEQGNDRLAQAQQKSEQEWAEIGAIGNYITELRDSLA